MVCAPCLWPMVCDALAAAKQNPMVFLSGIDLDRKVRHDDNPNMSMRGLEADIYHGDALSRRCTQFGWYDTGGFIQEKEKPETPDRIKKLAEEKQASLPNPSMKHKITVWLMNKQYKARQKPQRRPEASDVRPYQAGDSSSVTKEGMNPRSVAKVSQTFKRNGTVRRAAAALSPKSLIVEAKEL